MVRKHTSYTELQAGAPGPLADPLVGHITHNQACREKRALESCEAGP